jgi:hypothetical protein
MLRPVLLIAAAAFLAFLALVLAQSGLDGTEAVTGTPWGQVTLADFYLGVLCFGAVVWTVEGSAARALPWVVAIAVLGNPVAALWLVIRGLPALTARTPAAD